ncbi:hypothetical protein NGM10_14535 [Halorussus salilacus]|uniref:DUF7551 domain-containing protein n=1 Tax=Halorussus salilacus TaxID=2953750 RepID=UPI0020A0D945|nr:hypothetical protein [Halorussus salilacus]USZ67937.1 hypothetical protein NGM10_14535 [Halorussus salilacus]
MVGGTLSDVRERIAALSDDTGRYYVSCARTGERPVPVAGKRFPDRETAAEAAGLAAAYRAELRRYDSRLPRYALVVSEEFAGACGGQFDAPATEPPEETAVTDFCHDVAAVVFEALSALGETEVERAAMDAYLYSAESVDDPDELCLVLLSTVGAELDARLAPDRQHRVLRSAADRLGEASTDGDPLEATLARFDRLALVEDYRVDARDGPATGRSWRVALDRYAFDRGEDRLPTLPLAVDLLRRVPDRTVAVTDARPVADATWECVVTAGADRAVGLTNAVPENG